MYDNIIGIRLQFHSAGCNYLNGIFLNFAFYKLNKSCWEIGDVLLCVVLRDELSNFTFGV